MRANLPLVRIRGSCDGARIFIILVIPNIIVIRYVYVRDYVFLCSRGGIFEATAKRDTIYLRNESEFITPSCNYRHIFHNLFWLYRHISRTKVAGHTSYFHVTIFHIRSRARQHHARALFKHAT